MQVMLEKVDGIPLKDRDKTRKRVRIGTIIAAVVALGMVVLSLTSEKTVTSTVGGSTIRETVNQSAGERIGYLIGGLVIAALAAVGFMVLARLSAQAKRIKRYPAILKGVEQIRLDEVASIMTSDASTVSRDVELLIDEGTLDDFYVDHSSSKIVSKKYVLAESTKTVVRCTGCGANNEIIIGVRQVCQYCKQPLLAE